MSNPWFTELEAVAQHSGVDAALKQLTERLRNEKRYHELFEVRLIEARRRHGLPPVAVRSLEELPEPTRSQMEASYLDACREIGHLLLDDGQVREAWMYLRPVGDKAAVRAALEKLGEEEDFEPIIELAIYEGVAPSLGFELVLKHYGLCNAITMFDGQMAERTRAERNEVAALLVRHLHDELMYALRADIEQQQGSPAKETTVADLVRERDWLFAENNYHIDTTHLSSVVRFALQTEDREALRLALDLCAYGSRLGPQLQYHGDEPFVDFYPTVSKFIGALLGHDVDAAVAWFAQRAAERPADQFGPGPAEVYIGLLARLGRTDESLRAAAKFLPAGARGGNFAPNVLELAQQGRCFKTLREISSQRDDLLGFTVGLVGAANQ